MSILQIIMLVVVIPGFIRAFTGIRDFLTNHPKLGLSSSATKIAFVVVLVSIGMIAAPTLTLGLPAAFRLFTYAIYIGYILLGGLWVYDNTWGRRNGTTGTK